MVYKDDGWITAKVIMSVLQFASELSSFEKGAHFQN